MIDQRPKVANQRRRIGDWEGDTVEGRKGSGLLATHVDRKSRYTVAVKVANKSADIVTQATLSAMKTLPPKVIRIVTFDNGKEFADFKDLERGLGMRSYFAHSYHSRERGANENTNGLLCQYFRKLWILGPITQD